MIFFKTEFVHIMSERHMFCVLILYIVYRLNKQKALQHKKLYVKIAVDHTEKDNTIKMLV